MTPAIKVKTFATLQKFWPPRDDFPLEEGDTVGHVMDRLGIPPEKVTIIFVNNVHAGWESLLHHGDVLGLFPPVGGG